MDLFREMNESWEQAIDRAFDRAREEVRKITPALLDNSDLEIRITIDGKNWRNNEVETHATRG